MASKQEVQREENCDKGLYLNDLRHLYEELAIGGLQVKSRMLGRLLNLPRSIVDSIFDDSKDCLLFILDEWLKQDLDASWSAIAGALKNPLINYSRLANTIEKKYNLPPSTWSGPIVSNSLEDTLEVKSATVIATEIFEIGHKSEIFGRLLKLRKGEVKAILHFNDPQDRLLRIIDDFLLRSEPRPTWKAILLALRSPLINSPQIADNIEKKYFGKVLTSFHPPQITYDTDVPLNPDDAMEIVEEIIGVAPKAKLLGNALKLPPHVVNSLDQNYSNALDRLVCVIDTYLESSDNPTWKAIIEALRWKVGEQHLAARIQYKCSGNDAFESASAHEVPHSPPIDESGPSSIQADGPTEDGPIEGIDNTSSMLTYKPNVPARATWTGRPRGPRGTTLADSPGIAILVTCDYETNDKGTLSGTLEDAREMKITFDYLNYVVAQRHNPKKEDIESLLKEVADKLKGYNFNREEGKEKVIIFAFSGHGGSSEDRVEEIYANDGEPLQTMDEIVFPLLKHKGVHHVPKLFLIDACRGQETVTKKGAGNQCAHEQVPKSGMTFLKGDSHVKGNYCMAYATIPHHVAYGTITGSRWMPRLARALRERNDSFQNIAATVGGEVNRQPGENHQQCHTDSYLNDPVYLQKRE